MRLIEGGSPPGTTVEPTLPGAYYTSEGIFRRELERIWFDTWLLAGRSDELAAPGDFFLRTVADESAIVVRNREDGISAFYNVCRHRGARLCSEASGTFKSAAVRCPYHSWTYDTLRGALIAAPNVPDGEHGFSRADFPLHPVRAEAWGGFLWLNFNADAPGLAAALGLPETAAFYDRYGLDALKLGKRISYDVQANWKIVMENALECLHCSHIHPELSRCTPPTLPRHWLHEDLPESFVFKHSGGMEMAPEFEAVNIDGRSRRARFPGLTEGDARTIYYAFIYPHVLFGFAPDYVFFFSVWPLGVAETQVHAYWLFHPAEMAKPGFDGSDAIAFWDATNRQDWEACRLVQQGNRSQMYRPGGVLVPSEWRVNKFRRYVLELVPPPAAF
jgi:glycine betaine catabolism A